MAHVPEMMDLAGMVRARDYDRFLAIQLAPREKRPSLYAVTAFASELAQIETRVSEPMLGLIRLTWWREALEEIATGNAPRRHPVVLALAEVYRQSPAVFYTLFSVLDAYAEEGLPPQITAAAPLHLAWAQIVQGEISDAWRAKIFGEAELFEWADLLTEGAVSEKLSTISFQNSLTKCLGEFNKSLVSVNAEIGGDAWVTAVLRAMLGALNEAQKTWLEELKLLGALTLIARFNLRRMLRRSDFATSPKISAASPRKTLAILCYALAT